MENSFLISIVNNTNEPQFINLFSGNLQAGVTITAGKYDYQELQLIARTRGFKGNNITSNFESSLALEFVQNGKTSRAVLNGRYEQDQIVMDGFDNYLQFTCPPQKQFYLRLLSFPDVSL